MGSPPGFSASRSGGAKRGAPGLEALEQIVPRHYEGIAAFTLEALRKPVGVEAGLADPFHDGVACTSAVPSMSRYATEGFFRSESGQIRAVRGQLPE
jgi:hypothetical protein